MEQRVSRVAATLAHRLNIADAASLIEQMLRAPELHERLTAAEKLAAQAEPATVSDVEERRSRLPTSLPVGGIITPV